jgi:ribonuclease R
VGSEFTGRISGIARFGAFVKLDETGADGLLPMRALGREYFHYDREAQTLMGSDTGRLISIGQRVTVRLAEAVPVTGGIALELLEIDDQKVPQGRQSPAGRHPRRSATKAKRKKDKIKRKVARTRRSK